MTEDLHDELAAIDLSIIAACSTAMTEDLHDELAAIDLSIIAVAPTPS